MRFYRLIMFLAAIIAWFQSVSGQNTSFDMKNQASGWFGMNFDNPVNWQAGARYIPDISTGIEFRNNIKLDSEIAFNTYGNLLFSGFGYDTVNYALKPYRFWLRYSTPHMEIRAGLQKISFGSAYVFRPLMWFDRMDFRDPLQITEGVYSLLGKYYFTNNINIWLWTLYGNDKVKGWETVKSVRTTPEFGGRFQVPAGMGDLAISYHHRRADYSGLFPGVPPATRTEYPEQMFALDGKWDLGPGVWFEVVKKLNDKNNNLTGRWESWYSLGMDYTFRIGKGLSIISEYFHYSTRPEPDIEKIKNNIVTMSLVYPLFLSHSVSGIVYYNWDAGDWYRFLNIQFKYDYMSLYLMGFWNPEAPGLYDSGEGNNLFVGKGFQVMLVFNL